MKKTRLEGHVDIHLLTSVSLILSPSGISLLTNVESREVAVLINYRTGYT